MTVWLARALLLSVSAASGACDRAETSPDADVRGSSRQPTPAAAAIRNEDSARAAFGTEVERMLLDTHLHEIRGHLTLKVRNPSRDDESPLADQDVRAIQPDG